MTQAPAPTYADVVAARDRVATTAQRTPLVEAESLSALLGASVHLKLESLQPTGSFKVRGAANRLQALTPEQRARGVVTVSTGNHGRAVAYVGGRLGVPVTVCISELVPANKVAALRASGAELVIAGVSQDEAAEHAAALEL
ncbi:MAG: pyridoxal-phosphate dependent enzyme, partial [Trueperaceae bacterium]